MKHRRTSLPCGFQEDALIAVALDEADAALRQAVHTHIRLCQACCGVLCALLQRAAGLDRAPGPRETLRSRCNAPRSELTHRLVRQPVVHCAYHWCSTVLGKLCIAQSEHGVSLVTWETHASAVAHQAWRGRRALQCTKTRKPCKPLLSELQAYLAGTCDRLPWPIDERCMRSAFQRDVLHLTATIPYGAVMSYQSVACCPGAAEGGARCGASTAV